MVPMQQDEDVSQQYSYIYIYMHTRFDIDSYEKYQTTDRQREHSITNFCFLFRLANEGKKENTYRETECCDLQ